MVCKCLFKHRTTGYGTHQPMVLHHAGGPSGQRYRPEVEKGGYTDAVRIMKNNKMKNIHLI